MKTGRNYLDMGGEIPHIIICNVTLERAQEFIAAILGDEGVYCMIPGVEQIQATDWEGNPYIFYLRDLID